MNWWMLFGVVMTAVIEIGHATAGKNMYLAPAVASIENDEARTTMKFVWHLADVAFIVIAAVALLAMIADGGHMVRTVAGTASAFFAGLVVIHLWFSLRSGIANAPLKLFQWALFLVTSFVFLMAALS